MKQRPIAIGLLLCEQVIIEEKTRNVTPVNCFTNRTVEAFPAENFPIVVFSVLTDGMGDIALEIVIHRLDTLERIYRSHLTYRFADPLQNIRCILRISNCSFPVPGQYNISLLADGELVAHRKLTVLKRENQS